MNNEWYSFDVREEVLKDFLHYCHEYGINLPADVNWKDLSTSTLMDIQFLKKNLDSQTANQLKGYVENRFFYYRTKKYGNAQYWHAAEAERAIGYDGQWFTFIEELFAMYFNNQDKILFVGTANGSEIPQDGKYIYYALEQLETSANQIMNTTGEIKETIVGSFEDTDLFIDQPHSLSGIVALRCLTPNCRLDRFAKFVQNNMAKDGTLIISYPTSFLNKTGQLDSLPNIDSQLNVFELRLKDEFVQNLQLNIITSIRTKVEKIYILSKSIR